jgi:hypothetical protein
MLGEQLKILSKAEMDYIFERVAADKACVDVTREVGV